MTIAYGFQNSSLVRWNVADNVEVPSTLSVDKSNPRFAVSTDGVLLAYIDSSAIKVVSVDDGTTMAQATLTFSGTWPYDVAFFPGEDRLVVGHGNFSTTNSNYSVVTIDRAAGTLALDTSFPPSSLLSEDVVEVAVAANGSRIALRGIAAAGAVNYLTLVDTEAKTLERFSPPTENLTERSIALSNDGEVLAVLLSSGAAYLYQQGQTGAPLEVPYTNLATGGDPYAAVWAPDDARLYLLVLSETLIQPTIWYTWEWGDTDFTALPSPTGPQGGGVVNNSVKLLNVGLDDEGAPAYLIAGEQGEGMPLVYDLKEQDDVIGVLPNNRAGFKAASLPKATGKTVTQEITVKSGGGLTGWYFVPVDGVGDTVYSGTPGLLPGTWRISGVQPGSYVACYYKAGCAPETHGPYEVMP